MLECTQKSSFWTTKILCSSSNTCIFCVSDTEYKKWDIWSRSCIWPNTKISKQWVISVISTLGFFWIFYELYMTKAKAKSLSSPLIQGTWLSVWNNVIMDQKKKEIGTFFMSHRCPQWVAESLCSLGQRGISPSIDLHVPEIILSPLVWEDSQKAELLSCHRMTNV